MSVNLESCVLMTLISLTSEFLKINLMVTQILKETLKLLSIAGSFLLSDYFLSSIIPCSNLQRWGIKKGIVEVKCRCPLPQTQHNAPLSAQTQTSRPGVEPHELITAAPLYLVCLLALPRYSWRRRWDRWRWRPYIFATNLFWKIFTWNKTPGETSQHTGLLLRFFARSSFQRC